MGEESDGRVTRLKECVYDIGILIQETSFVGWQRSGTGSKDGRSSND